MANNKLFMITEGTAVNPNYVTAVETFNFHEHGQLVCVGCEVFVVSHGGYGTKGHKIRNITAKEMTKRINDIKTLKEISALDSVYEQSVRKVSSNDESLNDKIVPIFHELILLLKAYITILEKGKLNENQESGS